MRILQLHNKYRHYGGEDAVVANEHKLMTGRGFEVDQLFFDNTSVSPARLFYNRKSYQAVLKRIQQFKPDVIHIHNLFYDASPSILYAAKDRNIPVVMTLHNYRLLCPGGLFLRDHAVCTKCKDLLFPYHSVVHKCFKDSRSKSLALTAFTGYNKLFKTWQNHIDRFIVLTPFIKSLLVSSSLGVEPEKIVVKPNSTDDILGSGRKNTSQNKFLFVGRLSEEKGIDFLIRSFNQLDEFQLEVIGTGELETELRDSSNNNIVFLGSRDKSFIQKKLSEAKALLFPSIWYEGLPNTIIEAFSSGTPVLASNIDNINSIVAGGYNGELFQPQDFQDFSDLIYKFNSQNTSNYELNARKTYEEKYTHQKNFENLSELYAALL